MDGWLDKQQMDGWMDRKDRWMVECIVKKMDKNGLLDGQKMDGQIHGQNKQMDGQKEG